MKYIIAALGLAALIGGCSEQPQHIEHGDTRPVSSVPFSPRGASVIVNRDAGCTGYDQPNEMHQYTPLDQVSWTPFQHTFDKLVIYTDQALHGEQDMQDYDCDFLSGEDIDRSMVYLQEMESHITPNMRCRDQAVAYRWVENAARGFQRWNTDRSDPQYQRHQDALDRIITRNYQCLHCD